MRGPSTTNASRAADSPLPRMPVTGSCTTRARFDDLDQRPHLDNPLITTRYASWSGCRGVQSAEEFLDGFPDGLGGEAFDKRPVEGRAAHDGLIGDSWSKARRKTDDGPRKTW
ncbi:hypothetical protein SGA01_02060 [Streptomyces gardneri]|uniref:Uncharacterized protein n=1 Tax=Streptomyces gardneri TaxID=66892 RepID=A0A4Y3RA47_9ACTN|nr:hypothetical protein SGA01_02060 [Streptomyces gardneri]